MTGRGFLMDLSEWSGKMKVDERFANQHRKKKKRMNDEKKSHWFHLTDDSGQNAVCCDSVGFRKYRFGDNTTCSCISPQIFHAISPQSSLYHFAKRRCSEWSLMEFVANRLLSLLWFVLFVFHFRFRFCWPIKSLIVLTHSDDQL